MALKTLQKAGVEGVMVDCWWGIVEQAPEQYDFSAYRRLFEKIADSGLKVQVRTALQRAVSQQPEQTSARSGADDERYIAR